MLRDYPLFWYEEAGDPLDFQLQAALAEFYPGPMATGENLFSHQDARNLLRYGGMRPDRDWLQFDCALSYGLCEYQRTLKVLETQGWSPSRCIPHGGHQMSLNIAAGLGLGGNESYPDLFQPYGGFPDGVRVESGFITNAGAAGHRLRGQIRSLCGDEGAGSVGATVSSLFQIDLAPDQAVRGCRKVDRTAKYPAAPAHRLVGQSRRAFKRRNKVGSARSPTITREAQMPRQKCRPPPNARCGFFRAADVESVRIVEHGLVAIGGCEHDAEARALRQ